MGSRRCWNMSGFGSFDSRHTYQFIVGIRGHLPDENSRVSPSLFNREERARGSTDLDGWRYGCLKGSELIVIEGNVNSIRKAGLWFN